MCWRLLHFEIAFSLQPVRLVASVTEDDIAFFFGLKVPWAHKYYISLADPVSFLHLTPDAAHTGLSVLAFDVHSCISIILLDYAKHIKLVRHFDVFSDVSLVFY